MFSATNCSMVSCSTSTSTLRRVRQGSPLASPRGCHGAAVARRDPNAATPNGGRRLPGRAPTPRRAVRRQLTAVGQSDHNGHMTKVGVARLKAQLSRYLEVAKRGQEVVITERGRPVAKLVALGGADQADSRLERLIRAGVVIPGTGRLRASLRKP